HVAPECALVLARLSPFRGDNLADARVFNKADGLSWMDYARAACSYGVTLRRDASRIQRRTLAILSRDGSEGLSAFAVESGSAPPMPLPLLPPYPSLSPSPL